MGEAKALNVGPSGIEMAYERLGDPGSPPVLLVHGGGGKAFREWAEHWAARGYCALAMDLAGVGPAGRLADGGPDQSDETKFKAFDEKTAKDMWTYHAIADVIRGHNLLRSLPEDSPGARSRSTAVRRMRSRSRVISNTILTATTPRRPQTCDAPSASLPIFQWRICGMGLRCCGRDSRGRRVSSSSVRQVSTHACRASIICSHWITT